MFHASLRLIRMGTVQALLRTPEQVPIESPVQRNVAFTPSPLFSSPEFYRRPLPRTCVPFSSAEGKRLFREALLDGHMEAYFALAGQLCTQDEPSYCGLATLVMILNAYEMDPGRVWKRPWRWYHESLLKCCVPANVLTDGIVMDQFAEIAQCHGLHAQLHRITESEDVADFRHVVSRLTAKDNQGFLVVCYHRQAVGQTGSGHFAAVGGYHAERELVFLFDTARFKYPPHWVPMARLWEGMKSVDSVSGQPRGYLILTRASALRSSASAAELSSQSVHRPSLFAISDSARQAYFLPSALCDPGSIGHRLRMTGDAWAEWLTAPDYPNGDCSKGLELFGEAARFLLQACERHSPRSFFLSVIPPAEATGVIRESQQLVLRELLTSSVGQVVASVVAELPRDLFHWLTNNGTFQLSLGRSSSFSSIPESMSSPYSSSPSCPFAEFNDPGLRLCLILTCFLCAYPYGEVANLRSNTSPVTCKARALDQLLLTTVLFGETTRLELLALRTVVWSMIASALPVHDKTAGPCCGGTHTMCHSKST